jgi:hypothetical protein
MNKIYRMAKGKRRKEEGRRQKVVPTDRCKLPAEATAGH